MISRQKYIVFDSEASLMKLLLRFVIYQLIDKHINFFKKHQIIIYYIMH